MKMIKFCLPLFLLISLSLNAQQKTFTKNDTLRGSITPERAWWDLQYYHLSLSVDPVNKSFKGSNVIRYEAIADGKVMQIDLQEPLKITKVEQKGKALSFTNIGPAYFVELKKTQKKGKKGEIKVFYEGKPHEAVRAPWDGGITWSEDNNYLPFVASSCQGIGASIWWPCKDHMYDEVDSMMMSIEVPESLMDVSNGRLIKTDHNKKKKTKTYHWFVGNPINNYCVNINIGDYVHFGEKFKGENGPLDLDYYVLRDNLERAKKQFKDAPRTIEAFEHWFGPYPFYKDGFKLVEAPYLGMEHQSSVTYGNGYQNGYKGRDLSGTGWGLKFDFIIVHETGHEWFANNITYKDMADMWLHESFTNYSESLFLEYHFGKEAGTEYVRGTRKGIGNKEPIIGLYHLNMRGSRDMYPKGGNLLNTLRHVIDDDDKWREILRGLNKTFYHQTVTTQQIEDYISEMAGIPLKNFFDQYLRDYRLPILEYFSRDGELNYRWSGCKKNFDMPVDVVIDGKKVRLSPTTKWAKIKVKEGAEPILEPNFYVGSLKIQ